MKSIINYMLLSLFLFFAPIQGVLISVGLAIMLDTFTGIFKSIKLRGWRSVRSRKLSDIVSKMLLYEVCILCLFPIDHYVMNDIVIAHYELSYAFTKICAIVLMSIELTSVKENIEEAYNIKIWDKLKAIFKRAKEVKENIDEII